MKKSKFSEAQIAAALRQVEAGAPIPEVTRALGISEATYYVWRKQYGQMAIAEIRRLRQLEEENRRLKQLVADLTLDKVIFQEVILIVSPSIFDSCGCHRSESDALRVLAY